MNLEKFNPVIPECEDGFVIEDADPYFVEKSRILKHYLHIFTSTMQRKFNYLVYLDLSSGSGLKLLNNKIISGSPAIAFANTHSFSKYIFCEENQSQCDALRVRINKYCRHENVAILNGSPNNVIERLTYYLPDSSKGHRVSTLCVIDIKTLDTDFETIRVLSELGVNLLVIQNFIWADENVYLQFTEEQREKLNDFLGEPWSKYEKEGDTNSNEQFFRQLAKIYHNKLRSLGYISKGSFYPVESDDNELQHIFVGYYSHTRITSNEQGEEIKPISQVRLFE